MPKFTNKFNLPQAYVNAVTNDGYSRGDAELSVTQLLKPMQAVILEKQHEEEITEDVSDRFWALFGRATHTILEHGNKDSNILTERRLYMDVDGIRLSGGMDSYEISSGKLIDWKTASVYKAKEEDYADWEQQLNCYAELLRVNGHKITSISAFAIFKDHRSWEVLNKRTGKPMFENYPRSPFLEIPLTLWDSEKAMKFIRDRVQEYKKAKEQTTPCSDEERWADKPGASPTKRCGYCRVREFCAQYKELKANEVKPVNKGWGATLVKMKKETA